MKVKPCSLASSVHQRRWMSVLSLAILPPDKFFCHTHVFHHKCDEYKHVGHFNEMMHPYKAQTLW